MTISDKEIAMMNLLVANYAFNEDGSIAIDPKYKEKQGIKEVKWEMKDAENIVITYYWTTEKQETQNFTNDYEKLEYKIDVISEKELTLNMSDMFIVNLIIKSKK
jgi:23S rRNA A2030 N6-methylase RlmJ